MSPTDEPPDRDSLLSAFRDLMHRGDLPNDDITMDMIYGLKTFRPARLEREMTVEQCVVELRNLVCAKKRDSDGDR